MMVQGRRQSQRSFILVILLRYLCTGHAFGPFMALTANPTAAAHRYPVPSQQLFCQLLGMNCATESEVALTYWPQFCERGGNTDCHADGWGLAYYPDQSHGLRQFHDVEAASTSSLARFLGEQPIRTRNLLAHIRYATTGAVDLANVHPFAREMWALNWCFCHNGQVPLFEEHPNHILGGSSARAGDHQFYYPIGGTDSEATFCAILNALRAEFPDTMPTLPVLYEKLQSLCQEIVDYDREGTILNFLLSCGPHVLWVYSWPGRRPGSSVWNGLHYMVKSSAPTTESNNSNHLQAEDPDIVSLHVHGQDTLCIVATKPLTETDTWVALSPGELIVLDEGLPHVTATDLFRVELHGHGLPQDGKVLEPAQLEEDMRRYALDPMFFVGGGI